LSSHSFIKKKIVAKSQEYDSTRKYATESVAVLKQHTIDEITIMNE